MRSLKMNQCRATTKKEKRCRKQTDKKYCRLHLQMFIEKINIEEQVVISNTWDLVNYINEGYICVYDVVILAAKLDKVVIIKTLYNKTSFVTRKEIMENAFIHNSPDVYKFMIEQRRVHVIS